MYFEVFIFLLHFFQFSPGDACVDLERFIKEAILECLHRAPGHPRNLVETLEHYGLTDSGPLSSVASSLPMERINFCSFKVMKNKLRELKNCSQTNEK